MVRPFGTKEDASAELMDAVHVCDSWGEIEDLGDQHKEGRYSVPVFFDTPDQAAAFKAAVANATLF